MVVLLLRHEAWVGVNGHVVCVRVAVKAHSPGQHPDHPRDQSLLAAHYYGENRHIQTGAANCCVNHNMNQSFI